MQRITWYRAMCFGKAVGPWRNCKAKVQRDLIARDLGSYDKWGQFFITVPGDVETRQELVQSKAA
jgi:hypothetical protein